MYDEFQVRQDACMGERGYPVAVHEDGGRQYAGSGNLGQAGLLELLDDCAQEAGGQPTSEPLSEAEISALYDLDVQAYECLVAAGFDPEPPSTRDAYLAAFANDSPPWTPFSDASILSAAASSDPCPQPEVRDIPDQE